MSILVFLRRRMYMFSWESRYILDVGSRTRASSRVRRPVASSLVYQVSKFVTRPRVEESQLRPVHNGQLLEIHLADVLVTGVHSNCHEHG